MKYHVEALSKTQRAIVLNICLLLLATVFVLIYSQAGSPLYKISTNDCSIFKTIGLGILQGKLPYVDLFDHKGPLLFYLYGLACCISKGKLGLFILQVIFLYFSLFFQYKISRQFLSVKGAIVTSIIATVFLATVIDEGAQSEFFELTYIYISLYYAIKYLRDDNSISLFKLGLIIGACFGCVFLMRLNDAAQIGALSLSVFIYLILKKSYSGLWKFPCYCLLAFFMVCLPFVIYFSAKGALGELWYGVFIFNMKYVAFTNTHNYFLKILVFSFLLLSLILVYREKKYTKFCNYVLMPLIIIELFTIGNNPYRHYYIVITPIIALMSILLYNRYYVSLLLWILCISGWNTANGKPMQGSFINATYQKIKLYKEGERYSTILEEMQKMTEKVPVIERAQIWNLNSPPPDLDMFLASDLTPCNRFFVYTHRHFDPDILQKESLTDLNPKWIVCVVDWLTEEQKQWITNNYNQEYSYSDYDGWSIVLYKRNTECVGETY